MDYSIYKFYKGEKESPESLNAEQCRLWNAERVFEENFQKNDSSDWFAFFNECELNGKNPGEIFIKKLQADEHEKPKSTSKEWIFSLWLDFYLFVDKFPKFWEKYYKEN